MIVQNWIQQLFIVNWIKTNEECIFIIGNHVWQYDINAKYFAFVICIVLIIFIHELFLQYLIQLRTIEYIYV